MKSKAIKFLNSLINDNTTKSEIDVIEFCKKAVREMKEKEELPKVEWESMFETLWKLYPRKVNKVLAKKTFEHKIRGLSEEECREKCNLIYKLQMTRQKQWKEDGREMQYVSHYSTFLNNEVPNSKHYKGK